MGNVETAHRKVTDLATTKVDNIACRDTVGLVIVDDVIYCIMTRAVSIDLKEKQPVVMKKITGCFSGNNIQTQDITIHIDQGTNIIAMHANSITYHNHIFYLVTQNIDNLGNQIMAFGSNGIISAKYKYAGGKILTINYYGTINGELYFLVSTDRHQRIPYSLVKISGNYLVDVGKSFIALAPYADYDDGNDSYYDRSTKQLYITKFKKANDNIMENLVLQYDLSGGISGNGQEYSSVRTLHVAAQAGESRFEIEGICIYNGKKYVCVNSKDSSGVRNNNVCYLYKE